MSKSPPFADLNSATQSKPMPPSPQPKPRSAKSRSAATVSVKRLLASGKLPRVIGFANQKGGVGKSTTAVHMLDWFIAQGVNALLIDADAQRSSSPWAAELEHPFEVINDPDDLFDRLTELREDSRYDVIIVDGPGGGENITRMILNCVDLVLVPIKESVLDVKATTDILLWIQQAQKFRHGEPKAMLFFSIVKDNTLVYRDAKTAISRCQATILESSISYRTCVVDAPGQGYTVFGAKDRAAKAAANQFKKLFTEALEIYNG